EVSGPHLERGPERTGAPLVFGDRRVWTSDGVLHLRRVTSRQRAEPHARCRRWEVRCPNRRSRRTREPELPAHRDRGQTRKASQRTRSPTRIAKASMVSQPLGTVCDARSVALFEGASFLGYLEHRRRTSKSLSAARPEPETMTLSSSSAPQPAWTLPSCREPQASSNPSW